MALDHRGGSATQTPSHPSFVSSSQFKCCGSNSSADWQHSTYILSQEAQGRLVPDSCCKTVVMRCGQRAHPSNIYKVEVSAEVTQGLEEDPWQVQLSGQRWKSKTQALA